MDEHEIYAAHSFNGDVCFDESRIDFQFRFGAYMRGYLMIKINVFLVGFSRDFYKFIPASSHGNVMDIQHVAKRLRKS